MSKDKQKNIPMWAKLGHAKPVTRRDFLATGLIAGSATIFAPAWLKYLMPDVEAATGACAPGGSSLIPVVTLNLSGGGGLQANFVPMDKTGALLKDYGIMGLGSGSTLPLTSEFGGVQFAGLMPDGTTLISQFLAGVRSKAINSIANTAFVGVCVQSQDDTSSNNFAINGLLSQAGLNGSLLPNLGVTSSSINGINQASAFLSPPAPLVVKGTTSFSGALSYSKSSAAGKVLNISQQSSLAKLISSLSGTQTQTLQQLATDQQAQTLINCAGIKNVSVVGNTPLVDPRNDTTVGAALNTIWGTSASTSANAQSLIFSSSVYNVLNGNAGSAALEIGGFDYHDNTRTSGNAADLAAGTAVGQILETAYAMGKPLFLYVTTDGSVTSANSTSYTSPWTSDRGSAGMSYMLYYDPKGRRATTGNQVGWYTAGQVADTTFFTSGSPELSAGAVFANYLQLNGQLGQFSNIVPSPFFNSTNIPSVVKFT